MKRERAGNLDKLTFIVPNQFTRMLLRMYTGIAADGSSNLVPMQLPDDIDVAMRKIRPEWQKYFIIHKWR